MAGQADFYIDQLRSQEFLQVRIWDGSDSTAGAFNITGILEHDIQPQLSTEWGNRFQSTMDAFEQDSPSIQFKIESKEIYWVDICGKRNEYGIVQGRHIDHFFKNGSFPLYIVDAFSRREEETFYAYNR